MTMGPCTVGFVAHEALIKLCELRPNVAHAFWRITLIDAAIFRECVANGSRQGVSRMAHMFCEQAARLGAVGLLGKDFSFQFPVTQNEIGDAMGLSTVHVNRSLQELRQKRLVRFDKFTMKVIDWAGLQDAGDFDPAYLFLTKPYLPAGVVASAFPVSIGRKI